MPMSPWEPTTDKRELRRLGKSVEELGELVAVLGRTICQGLDGVDPASGEDNLTRMTKESADVIAQIKCNVDAFRLDNDAIMARADQKVGLMAEWERLVTPTVKYLLCPGTIESKRDGQWHFINARQLANLYGVRLDECVISHPQGPLVGIRPENVEFIANLIPLHPRYSGDYTLPIPFPES